MRGREDRSIEGREQIFTWGHLRELQLVNIGEAIVLPWPAEALPSPSVCLSPNPLSHGYEPIPASE